MEDLIINVLIGLVIIVGFFFYLSKNSEMLKEGGIIYEWWHGIWEKRKIEKKLKKEEKRKAKELEKLN